MGCQRNNQGLGVNMCVGTETQAENWGMNLPVQGSSRKGPLGGRSPWGLRSTLGEERRHGSWGSQSWCQKLNIVGIGGVWTGAGLSKVKPTAV